MTQDLAPWEIPPDEAYWQALLKEGEYTQRKDDHNREPDVAPRTGSTTSASELGQDTALSPADEMETVLSDSTLHDQAFWDMVAQYKERGTTVELTVIGYNRGGLLVDLNGLKGFVPASQICTRLPHGNDQLRSEALAARVGETITLKVIECEPAQNHVILSERVLDERPEPDQTLLATLCPGDICRGRVTNLCSFGAFVDLGGVEGLVHISELSWGRVSCPEDVLQSGQEVDVYVLNVNPGHGRVSLSVKRLQPDPWDAVEERYHVGQVVEGVVTSVVSFGAFVRLEEGLEGLIHVSRLQGDDGTTELVVKEDQAIQVQVISIDGEQHRIGLALEQT